jgi:glycosyltransferase involved in cell wall biosynthesis
MVIGFDGNEANTDARVGIHAYAYAIFSHMVPLLGEDMLRVYLKDKPMSDLPKKSNNVSYERVGPRRLWTQIGLPFRLFTEKKKPDIFFTPSHYAPRFSPVPVAIAVMDVSFLHFPETFAKKDLLQLTNWTKYSIKKARVIFTISQASKNDILEKYHVPKDRVVVTYPGIRDITSLRPEVFSKHMTKTEFGIKGDYFLFVGTLQPRKNIVGLVEAFSKLLKEKKIPEDVSLVIVGKKGWLYEEIVQAPEMYDVKNLVKFLEFVDDEDLPLLYKNAIAFVLPSLYEGFGLPVLEAMNYGCPVITSSVSSLPEAGGDAALYVDPKDVSDIASKMEKIYKDKNLRSEMIEKGKKQVTKFSWEKSAEKTLEVLREVVGNK